MFSSKNFIVSGLAFRSFIHFEFIFVYGASKCSNLPSVQSLAPSFPFTLLPKQHGSTGGACVSSGGDWRRESLSLQ